MQLFYNPDIDENTTNITFTKDESKHIVKVLRKTSGDTLEITNGKGWLFIAEIVQADIKNCQAIVLSKTFQPPRNYKVHLAVAPTKMNERYEWFLEKATEIGVDTITPIICDHSERKVVKTERFEKIIQAAMKQSLHYYLPILEEPIAFNEFVLSDLKGQKFIAHCEERDRKAFKNALKQNEDVVVLIGPEGDFSTSEIDLATAQNFKAVTLGNTRLRTETAAVVACHTIALINEN